jgi:protein-L-isoaspartate(D-aspartate) O-methyltransferase
VEFNLAADKVGWPAAAPYDRIICAAAAEEIPRALLEQLAIKGKAVLPVRNSIFYFERKNQRDFVSREYPGFAFVPLISY